MRAAGLGHIPLVVGGIIPDDDAATLRAMGVAPVYTPKDFQLNRIIQQLSIRKKKKLCCASTKHTYAVGTKMALLSRRAGKDSERISEVVEYLELAAHPDFSIHLYGISPLPETD